ncbi:precorrin-2 C(20)-methyltransferase [Lampropedia puyangensis]|uniref:Precorrin-2 C(20)-methyltransferase n=1 Tax=Lampropedia puyangensis TaxID=1330072 RepID=A0A4V4GRG0_9BURK|nr:precorrin-2 C(20)-methyltransferase [Lampropedia puyangensis]THU02016.1 precorrin-2 C(20)-methyltransferase [Lampropedia puyangensis]
MTGSIICVGLGPGDPELISVKADRLLRSALQVAYFRKRGHKGKARELVEGILNTNATEYPMEYPVTTEIPHTHPDYGVMLHNFYEEWQQRLSALAQQGDVIVLCEGDPFLYGSFMHLYIRLREAALVTVEVLPGIPGMVGCWHATGQPMTWGDDILSVIPATLPAQALQHHVQQADALVIMKVGRRLPHVKAALQAAGKLEQAWLVINGTMAGEQVMPLTEAPAHCPYFSIILVHGHGRRPGSLD